MSSARSVAAKMAAVTRDLPIKMSSMTKLERNGSNFQHWELEYISFIPDVVMYFNGERMPADDPYSQEWADVGNASIYDRELARNPRENHSPFDRIEELREPFSGVSFAARQASYQIVATRYDPTKTTIDSHINEIRTLRDKLQQAGTALADDRYD